MEMCFHDRFYRPLPEVTIVDLMNMRQMIDESTINFIERFRKVGSCCLVQLLEVKCVAMAVS